MWALRIVICKSTCIVHYFSELIDSNIVAWFLYLATLWLQPRRDVGLQCAILPLDSADADLQARRVRLASVSRQQEIAAL